MVDLQTKNFWIPSQTKGKQSPSVALMRTSRMAEQKNGYETYRTRQERCSSLAKSSSTHLWLYAVHYVNDVRNNIPTSQDAQSPLQKFTGTNVQAKVNTFHTFGCPVYVLDSGLASGKKIPKWNPRCMLGLYLGNSPRHARSVSQVLNLDTGRVSPQFHVIHDEFFDTIALQDKIRSNWKRLAGFTPVQLTVPSPPNFTPPLAVMPSDPPPVIPQ